jgi:hypothetical protein
MWVSIVARLALVSREILERLFFNKPFIYRNPTVEIPWSSYERSTGKHRFSETHNKVY